MATSKMWLFVSMKPIHAFPLYVFETSARTSAQTTHSMTYFNGIVWEELSVIKDEKGAIKEGLRSSLRSFLDQYFKTNPSVVSKAVFYLGKP
ncbi:MAG: hypothetical protein P0S96_04460 [Simkaniaceae bacterium]|nr:hypothetical protein [Candidatus Sacchlamyda saccharinae]